MRERGNCSVILGIYSHCWCLFILWQSVYFISLSFLFSSHWNKWSKQYTRVFASASFSRNCMWALLPIILSIVFLSVFWLQNIKKNNNKQLRIYHRDNKNSLFFINPYFSLLFDLEIDINPVHSICS